VIPADLVAVKHYHGSPECVAHCVESLDRLQMQVNVEELR
jgi:hypothetical protein